MCHGAMMVHALALQHAFGECPCVMVRYGVATYRERWLVLKFGSDAYKCAADPVRKNSNCTLPGLLYGVIRLLHLQLEDLSL